MLKDGLSGCHRHPATAPWKSGLLKKHKDQTFRLDPVHRSAHRTERPRPLSNQNWPMPRNKVGSGKLCNRRRRSPIAPKALSPSVPALLPGALGLILWLKRFEERSRIVTRRPSWTQAIIWKEPSTSGAPRRRPRTTSPAIIWSRWNVATGSWPLARPPSWAGTRIQRRTCVHPKRRRGPQVRSSGSRCSLRRGFECRESGSWISPSRSERGF